ncbi:hypothetical protein A3C26_01175 [Candidatus Daviesbacteria bacterium RIFCSPHIGHO2_02_FULL_39_12]|uniref:Uncharacterized protein n=2 Tax=Candidatus Daviesiibacteriota TaxID=1752718 RepID=A0A1F5J8P8_9BACT|nr:MAG: hypothetical protein A3C26_01175 [Candidatus Daviesbacteria bacterium RIFCSPHIGHO2_02_FULL_39_12]OGE72278.1 MAG: hypothetical protein A3H40_02175 [Candidatus Daviesbacteria bacterium RIFCSPLOWO2_02_FULL_38_15]
MSSRKTFYILITTILAIAFFVTVFKEKTHLTNPVSPTPLATPAAPKTFQFDRNTDLRLELENVNPQVLDSDFE